MRGVTKDGQVIDLHPMQEHIVQQVRIWATSGWGHRNIMIPAIGRQGGRSTLLATLAAYDELDWPDDLPEGYAAGKCDHDHEAGDDDDGSG